MGRGSIMPKFISDEEMKALETKTTPKKRFISDEEMMKLEGLDQPKEPIKDTNLMDSFRSGVRSAANTITFGGYPYAVAGLDEVAEALNLKPEQKFDDRVQYYKDIIKMGEEKHPIASGAGSIVGAVTGGGLAAKGLSKLPAVGGLFKAKEGAGLVTRLGQAGLASGTLGALETPEEGFFDLEGRLKNAAIAAPFGIAGQGAAEAGGKILKSGKKLAEKLGDAADASYLKQLGVKTGKQFENLFGKSNQVKPLVKFAKDKGILKISSTIDDVESAATKLAGQSGEAIGKFYDDALNTLSKTPGKQASFLSKLSSSDALKAELRSTADSIKVPIGKKRFMEKADDLIEEILDSPVVAKNPKLLAEKITALSSDRFVDYSKPMKEQDEMAKLVNALRLKLRDRLSNISNVLTETNPNISAEKIKKLNEEFSKAATIQSIASKKAAADRSRNFLGMNDVIIASAGGVGGGLMSGDLEGVLKGASLGLLSKGARKYGPGLMGKGLSAASKGASTVTAPADALGNLVEYLAKDPATVGAATYLINKYGDKK